ncbi:flagellar motor component MotA [Flavobacterium sp. 260]|nr:flagellar motor component MotA [Curtobacterium sp. 260]
MPDAGRVRWSVGREARGGVGACLPAGGLVASAGGLVVVLGEERRDHAAELLGLLQV